tara:strand:- start:254 stop:682 length:429 start_codon:yes stop_codon:yes gene_type:complete
MKLLIENWREYLNEEEDYADKIVTLLKNPDHVPQAKELIATGIIDSEQLIQKLWDIILPAQKKEEARGHFGPRFKNNKDYYHLRNGIATLVGACDPYCSVDFIPRNKYTPVHPEYGEGSVMFLRHSNTWTFEEFREMFEGKL